MEKNNQMTEEVLQIGKSGADIEMHILKNKIGIYFVSFQTFFVNSDKMRVPFTDELLPAYPFCKKEDVYNRFGSIMCGKNINI